jgi:hypothetical protein
VVAAASSSVPLPPNATPVASAVAAAIPGMVSAPSTASAIVQPHCNDPSNRMEAAWNILMTDESWRVSTTKGEWQIRLGAHAADALEFIVASEIDELETLLAPIAFRRFKKFLTYE